MPAAASVDRRRRTIISWHGWIASHDTRAATEMSYDCRDFAKFLNRDSRAGPGHPELMRSRTKGASVSQASIVPGLCFNCSPTNYTSPETSLASLKASEWREDSFMQISTGGLGGSRIAEDLLLPLRWQCTRFLMLQVSTIRVGFFADRSGILGKPTAASALGEKGCLLIGARCGPSVAQPNDSDVPRLKSLLMPRLKSARRFPSLLQYLAGSTSTIWTSLACPNLGQMVPFMLRCACREDIAIAAHS